MWKVYGDRVKCRKYIVIGSSVEGIKGSGQVWKVYSDRVKCGRYIGIGSRVEGI